LHDFTCFVWVFLRPILDLLDSFPNFFIEGDKAFSLQVQQSRKMSFSVLMMTDDFYLIRQYNRQRGAQGLGGSNKTKPREILNMSDLRNQGSTNARNLRILHLMNLGY